MCMRDVQEPVRSVFFLSYIFGLFYAFNGQDSRELTGKHWSERGEQDRQRTLRQESNSGSRNNSCAI